MMTTRRNLLRKLGFSSAAAAAALTVPSAAQALMQCGPTDWQGLQHCESGIDSRLADVVANSVNGQHMSQWCWAACIEMAFRCYGYVIPQAEIVRQTWGGIVNLPGQPWQILSHLNRGWRDAQGRPFRVSADVSSANPVTAMQDLSQGMPLIIGTMGHAMLLTSLQYVRNAWGQPQVTAAIVRDPWPGRGRRMLSAQEWYSTDFLARIRVEG